MLSLPDMFHIMEYKRGKKISKHNHVLKQYLFHWPIGDKQRRRNTRRVQIYEPADNGVLPSIWSHDAFSVIKHVELFEDYFIPICTRVELC